MASWKEANKLNIRRLALMLNFKIQQNQPQSGHLIFRETDIRRKRTNRYHNITIKNTTNKKKKLMKKLKLLGFLMALLCIPGLAKAAVKVPPYSALAVEVDNDWTTDYWTKGSNRPQNPDVGAYCATYYEENDPGHLMSPEIYLEAGNYTIIFKTKGHNQGDTYFPNELLDLKYGLDAEKFDDCNLEIIGALENSNAPISFTNIVIDFEDYKTYVATIKIDSPGNYRFCFTAHEDATVLDTWDGTGLFVKEFSIARAGESAGPTSASPFELDGFTPTATYANNRYLFHVGNMSKYPTVTIKTSVSEIERNPNLSPYIMVGDQQINLDASEPSALITISGLQKAIFAAGVYDIVVPDGLFTFNEEEIKGCTIPVRVSVEATTLTSTVSINSEGFEIEIVHQNKVDVIEGGRVVLSNGINTYYLVPTVSENKITGTLPNDFVPGTNYTLTLSRDIFRVFTNNAYWFPNADIVETGINLIGYSDLIGDNINTNGFVFDNYSNSIVITPAEGSVLNTDIDEDFVLKTKVSEGEGVVVASWQTKTQQRPDPTKMNWTWENGVLTLSIPEYYVNGRTEFAKDYVLTIPESAFTKEAQLQEAKTVEFSAKPNPTTDAYTHVHADIQVNTSVSNTGVLSFSVTANSVTANNIKWLTGVITLQGENLITDENTSGTKELLSVFLKKINNDNDTYVWGKDFALETLSEGSYQLSFSEDAFCWVNGNSYVYNSYASKEVVYEPADPLIDGIRYQLDKDNSTASVIKNGDKDYSGNVTIPESVLYHDNTYFVTAIAEKAFYQDVSLNSVIMPSTITSIGKQAFQQCTMLDVIVIPENVTEVGENAFAKCEIQRVYNLSSLEFENSEFGQAAIYNAKVTPNKVIYSDKFIQSNNNNEDNNTDENTDENSEGNTGSNEPIYDGTIILYYYGDAAEVDLAIEGKSVTTIAPSAFYKNGTITRVTIPETVTTIGESAFEDCKQLTSVNIPAGMTAIATSTFKGCANLTSIELPSVLNTIGTSAFEGCGFTSISIPASVTRIHASAFKNCGQLRTIQLPESLNSLGESAFENCVLTSVNIPSSITSIGVSTFKGCKLTSIEIPNGVTSIGDSAFKNCTNLSNIALPKALTTIGASAFANSGLSSDLYLSNRIETVGANAFSDTNVRTIYMDIPVSAVKGKQKENFSFPGNATLYIPVGSKESYESAGFHSNDDKGLLAAGGQLVEANMVFGHETEKTLADGKHFFCFNDEVKGVDVTYTRTFVDADVDAHIWYAFFVPCTMKASEVLPHGKIAYLNRVESKKENGGKIVEELFWRQVTAADDELTPHTAYIFQPNKVGETNFLFEDATIKSHVLTEDDAQIIDSHNYRYTIRGNYAPVEVAGKDMMNAKLYLKDGNFRWTSKEGATLQPFRIYMTIGGVPSQGSAPTQTAPVFRNVISGGDDTPTAVEGLEILEEGVYYDLQGNRVENPTPGIYILNGVKVVVK